MTGRRPWGAAALLLLLAVVHTWPLARDPGGLSRIHDDEWLNAWAVSWIAHQLPRDPLHLFDANMYHPERGAMGYTEPLIVPALLGAPLRWLGASALLTHNLLVLLGLTLTGLALYRLVAAWTGDHWSGVLAGALLAFSTVMLTRLPHLQIVHFYPLPLAVLALDRVLRRGGWAAAAALAACVLAAGLTSGYLVVFTVLALGAALLARAPEVLGRQGAGVLLKLAAAAAVTLALLLLVLQPYVALELRREETVDAAGAGAALQSYLASRGHLHHAWWSAPFAERAPRTMFPGAVTLGLALVALAARRGAAPRGVRRMLIAVIAAGVVLSLGALTPLYSALASLLPPLQSMRAPSRFGVLALFGLAALAGLGLAALRARLPAGRRLAVSLALLALATAESLHAPFPFERFDYARPIYRMLAAMPEAGAAVELPIHTGGRFNQNARYLLASTLHWRRLVNGFGAFAPPDFDRTALLVGRFPDPAAVAHLDALGVRYAVVHTDRYARPEAIRAALAQLSARPDLRLVAEHGPDRLYRILPGGPRPP